MFVIACFAVLSAAYWISAFVAHLVLDSPQERALPAAARAGVGLLFSLTFFSAAWQFFSPAQSWLLGIALLLGYALSRRSIRPKAREHWRGLAREHAWPFAACVAVAFVFFSPLAVKQRFGPFSEGGGDVSIYADSAQYIGELKLTARGTPAASIEDVAANLRGVLETTMNREVISQRALQRYVEADRALINPPAAENAVYRSIALRSFSPFLYAPYVEFHFLAGATNYHVYYGIQALVYSLLILCGWGALARFGRAPAAAYSLLLLGSHALISVFYNTYSAQAFALFSCVLLLCLLLNGVRPWSFAGLRTCVIPFIFIVISYAYYFSVLAPLLALAWLVPTIMGASQDVPPRTRGRGFAWLVTGVCIALLGLLLYGGSEHSLMFVHDLTVARVKGGQNVYMGEHLPAFSFRWNAFLFGFISQQHLLPFASELPWLNNTIKFGIACGTAVAAIGFAITAYRLSGVRGVATQRFPRDVAVLGVLALTAAAHLYVAQAYIYTQAKGAQNVLPVLYAALVLPLAMLLWDDRRTRALRLARALLASALVLFAATLAVPRAVSAYKIARGLDRATILEPSFFAEAERVRAADSDAYVLFEPRKSADLYMSIQPFYGGRMIPTRHLVLTRLRFETRPPEPQRFDGSFFVTGTDLPHLWKLGSTREAGRDTWRAERIATEQPGIHLFADDYAQDQGDRARSARSGDTGRFSWLRNGSALIYLPPGGDHTVEVTLAARDGAALAKMKGELAGYAAAGQLPPARLEERPGTLQLEYRLPASNDPRLERVARFSAEYWVNIRLDGKELPKSPFAPRDTAAVSAVIATSAAGLPVARVSWTGVINPDRQDWIGVFPEGGGDETRMAFKFTGSRESGELDLELPVQSAGALDVRFFRAGTWNAVAATRVQVPAR